MEKNKIIKKTNKKSKKKKKNKPKTGFTLIELLAVIVILGLLMAIAIPSVTKYITESRKKTLASTISNYMSAVTNQVNDMEYVFTESNVIYAVPIECVALERGGTNPFGEWMQANNRYWAYTLVQYNDESSSYTYGFTFKDSAGYGLYPTTSEKLTESGTQINTDLELNKPRTGNYLNVASKDIWENSGFIINDNTKIKVLTSMTEDKSGDGKNTCTLMQKGKNYEEIENEKNKPSTLINNKTSTNLVFGNSMDKNTIEEIYTQDNIEVPTNAINSWDASVEGNETTIAWITDDDNNGMYTLYLGSANGKIILPADSSSLFYGYANVKNIDLKYVDTSGVTSMVSLFAECNNLVSIDLISFNTSKVTNMYRMFKNCYKLKNIDVSNFDTSKVTNMQTMFYNCESLTSLNVSNFNTSNVTNMQTMFYNANSLTSLDVTNWNTSKVTNMNGTFENCQNLVTLNVSNWDTSNVTNMQNLFKDDKNITALNVSGWNTSKVTDMQNMFKNCAKITVLDLKNFDTSKVTNMYAMFYGVSGITSLDIKNWNTSNVENIRSTFSNMKLSTLDLSNWNTSKVTNMQTMFAYTNTLNKIDFRNASINNVSEYTNMFYGVPTNVQIIVKDNTTKSWIQDKLGSGIGTVKTIDEL